MKRYNRDFKMMILEFHKSGQTIKSVSVEYDVSRAAIHNPQLEEAPQCSTSKFL